MNPPLKRKTDNDITSKFKKVKKCDKKDKLFQNLTEKSRRQKRKATRTLKKMRKDAFMRNKPLPTYESIQKTFEEDEKIRNKIKKNRERQKTKNINRKIRVLEGEMKERELNVVNKQDNKTLKSLEKKLRITKERGLPKSFREDSLGYVLEYMDEAKSYMLGQKYESDDDGDDSKPRLNGPIDDDDDDDDDMEVGEDDDDEYDIYDDDNVVFDDDEDFDDDDDDENECEEAANKSSSKGKTKKVHSNLPNKEDDGSDDDDEDNKKTTKEDIYGRKVSTSKGDYVPPAMRKLASLGGKQTNLELNRQVMGILNKLSENNMTHSCKEFEQLFKDNSRQSVCSSLENGITRLCLTDEPCSRLLVVHCCFLVSFLHNQIGTEISANILQFVVTELCSLFEDSKDDTTEQEDQHKINNCLLLICQLYDFKVMESILILDVTRKFLRRFYIKDINLINMLIKEVGPRMRKDDPISFKEILVEIISKTNNVPKEASSMKKLLTKNLVDLLTVLKNNQFHKVPSYDPDAFARRTKLFQSIVKSSSVIPLKVTLEDIEQCDTRGKWWLVGSAWSGRDREVAKDLQSGSTGNYDPSIVKLAKAQRMDSGIKMDIFCSMMSAEDNDDAFERLMRLNLKTEQQHEIMHVIITTCLKSLKFNPFYAHLISKFCKYHRRFTMACKCSIWDKVKVVSSMSDLEVKHLTKLLKNLIEWGILPLTVLKNVDFTSFDEKTSRLVDGLLRHLLTKCDNFARLFRAVSYDNNFRVLKLSLDFFIRTFYVEKEGEDKKLARRAGLALDALNEPPMKEKTKKEDDDDFFQFEEGNPIDD